MRLIRKKLKSERGASLILALLFMLICLMVGSSILMAAMANAGKIRSNQREQQAYMVLSSALKLVADDLTSKPYRAEFTYKQEKATVLNGVEVTTHTFTCLADTTVSVPGEFTCELGEIFKNRLNVFFARNMMLRSDRVGTYTTQNKFTSDLTNLVTEDDATSFPLTNYGSGSFTVQSDKDELNDFVVNIDWKLEENYTLYLTATIAEVPAEYGDGTGDSIYKNYVMKAELTPAAGKDIPGVGKTSSTGEPTIVINNSLQYDEYEEKSLKTPTPEKLYSTPLQWEIGWITGNNEEKP